jgi:hypothetical protein
MVSSIPEFPKVLGVKKIVYIMSDNRSGSTLLDQLLGAHEKMMSLGEVHHLCAYALQDRSLYNPVHPLECSCGKVVEQCVFWSHVEQELGQPLGSLLLKPRFFERSGDVMSLSQRARRFFRSTAANNPQLLRYAPIARILNAQRVAMDSFALYDAVFEQTSATYLIDSSKSPFRFRMLYDEQPRRLCAIILGRDYRGVVHSSMKRGWGLESSARTWARCMRQINELTKDIPPQARIRVRYEDLCADPRAELSRICDFLNLNFSEEMLCRPSGNVHHIGGSPSKFDPDRTRIKLDQSYSEAFTLKQLTTMKEIAGEAAAAWGYE